MPAGDIRVALIGYGLAGACFHAPTIAVTAGLKLVTIVTSNPERRERAKREHPSAHVVDSADPIFERASESVCYRDLSPGPLLP